MGAGWAESRFDEKAESLTSILDGFLSGFLVVLNLSLLNGSRGLNGVG